MKEPIEAGPEKLSVAWKASRNPLITWVRNVEAVFNECGLDVLDASEGAEFTAAELEAVIRLALLDDSSLELVSDANPPITTWLLLSEVASEDLPTVLEEAGGITDASSDYQRMLRAFSTVTGSAPASAVRNLDPTLFEFAVRKATLYNAWKKSSPHYGALGNFASRRKAGRPLTSRQTAYAKGLLLELVDAGVIQVPSPDGDDELCRLVIQAVS